MEDAWSFVGMFTVAFGAATLLPAQSEVLFAALQIRGSVSLTTLIVVASLGNILGSVVNYLMGMGVERFRGSRWFPVGERQLDRAQNWYRRWGVWTLLLSWAPFGDGITVVAGILRTPWWIFVGLVTLAKTGRYAVLAAATAGVT
ncbi:YqaA family protein [Palleronia abyssalis]|uniref:Inner membrane protein YqaA n=1 Tax=Palleronia abyssalis TaxID=1501240 RepID=A0A2R8BYJ5_9RHOB|nr:YqaA family protein [Palleronia abyssalis]SPJ25199.1 Inner membrane protein YqaA [Palleronia abyssalis]